MTISSYSPDNSTHSDNKQYCFVMPWHFYDNRGGGAELQAWYLAREMHTMGLKVSYICQSTKNKESTELVEGIPVYRLPATKKFQWLAIGKYYKKITEISPDVMIQRMASPVSFAISKYKRKNGKKFVWICSDDASATKWMHIKKYIHFQNGISTLKQVVFLANAFINDVYRIKAMRHVDVAFTQNQIQESTLKKNFNINSVRIITGHTVPSLKRVPSVNFKNKTLLWVANIAPRKRPELFIDLARKLHHKGYTCVLIGSRSDSTYLNNIFNDPPSNLQIKGKLNIEEVNRLIEESTFLVNTSCTGAEGFPNTFVQAWLRGIPVLSYGIDPNNIIVREKLGIVVTSSENVTIFLEQLSAHKYIEMSDNAVNYSKHYFDVKKTAVRFIADLKQHI